MASAQSPQPLASILTTGIIGSILVFIISASVIFSFEHHYFVDYVATAFMAATPGQVILGLLWHNSVPEIVERQSQPVKGILLTVITIAIGAVVMTFLMKVMSGGHGATPMLIQYAILSVVAVLWLVPIWGCWPFSALFKNPIAIGICTLILAYIVAYILQQLFFDYSLLGKIGHPHYYADMDPKGIFGFWAAMTFFVTTAMVVIVTVLFEFWPINKLAGSLGQPLRGLVGSVYVLVVAYLVRSLFVDVIGMEQVEYLVRVPVSIIFGAFLVNNMMQFSLFIGVTQPLRGVYLTLCAIVAALIMFQLYSFASSLHAGAELGMGPANGFAKELWIASAMLGVTFPIIFVISGFFGFWPIKKQSDVADSDH